MVRFQQNVRLFKSKNFQKDSVLIKNLILYRQYRLTKVAVTLIEESQVDVEYTVSMVIASMGDVNVEADIKESFVTSVSIDIFHLLFFLFLFETFY